MRGTRPLPRPMSTGSSARPICPPFLARYVYACPWALDLDALQRCARVFEGEHDFQSFAANDPDLSAARAKPRDGRASGRTPALKIAPLSTIRTIYSSAWEQRQDEAGAISGLPRARQRLSASHGAQPGGNHAGCGSRTSCAGRDSGDSRGARSLGSRTNGAGARLVSAFGGVRRTGALANRIRSLFRPNVTFIRTDKGLC